ncbi:phycobilisome linker polypeptide [Calothrix sp. PCC 6303]|uniref:phycobilisome linker polypeptide n=1 Tax=Calothrix sp. PCC 6303 TaxID=1170562 RepID=UPI001939D461|nr:phycobilisome linker polypeptide [Calothrix sp. PCC 6303]
MSDYNNRMVLLEVTGVLNANARNSHQIIKVPYSRLSQTVKRICRAGGKIVNVTMPSFSPSEVTETIEQNQIVETVAAETVEETPIVETVEETPIIETVEETPIVESVEETPVAETVVVEIVPQAISATSKKTTSKAKGMGEKPSKNTKRDRKPKSRH